VFFGVGLSVYIACVAVKAQVVDTIDPAMKTRIDAIAAGVMEQQVVPSASVAVVQGGKLIYARLRTGAHRSR
jgi:D-alanyl-D-alanine carboxypeptidase